MGDTNWDTDEDYQLLMSGALSLGEFLQQAIQYRNMNVVQSLIECGFRKTDGDTPLHYACRSNAPHIKVNRGALIELLVESGADPNARNDRGTPAWMCLSFEELNLDIFNFLFENGAGAEAGINDTDDDGFTALHWVGNLDVARWFIEKGADVNIKTVREGTAPLHFVSRGGTSLKLELARLFIENGADPNAKDNKGKTPLHIACEGYGDGDGEVNEDMIKLLVRNGADPNAKDDKGNAAWVHGNLVGSLTASFDIFRFLLDHGADVKATDADGWTALHWFDFSYFERATLFIENGADVNAADNNGFTPLHDAVDPERVQYLMDHGADPNAQNNDGLTPLHFLCKETRFRSSSMEQIEILIKNRAEIDAKDHSLWTPLHSICHVGRVEVAKLLLRQKANVNAETNEGLTPLQIACKANHQEVVSCLIDNGADIHAKNHDGWTPLHWACNVGRVEVAKLLLRQKANVSAKTNEGLTPLQIACEANHQEVAWWLVREYPWLVMESSE